MTHHVFPIPFCSDEDGPDITAPPREDKPKRSNRARRESEEDRSWPDAAGVPVKVKGDVTRAHYEYENLE